MPPSAQRSSADGGRCNTPLPAGRRSNAPGLASLAAADTVRLGTSGAPQFGSCVPRMGLTLALLPSASGLLFQAGLLGCLPPTGGRLNRACGTGDTHRRRSGRHGGPANGGVNLCPPTVRCGQPNSPVMETPRRTLMPVPMKRTTFWLRKEITVFEYERGLLYPDGKLERVLEPVRY